MLSRFAAALAVAFASALAAGPGAAAADLVLKRVLLSTGGVGYFEYEAAVDGNTELTLPVRLDQVDDVLKSVIVFDDKGNVGNIVLPGREPLAEVFRDLPFSESALNSPVALLNALRGVEVSAGGPKQVQGKILKVEAETARLPDNAGALTRHRVTVLAADGIKSFVLEEVDSVRFADAKVQAQVDRALAALARHRVQDIRELAIAAHGAGKRTLRVGYVVAAPLWKASYRLTVGTDATDAKGLLQGWGVLENLSGRDWNGVELTLVSGNPVTFRQQLYNAYFVNRPEVPVEVFGRVLPPPDAGTLGPAEEAAKRAELQGGPMRGRAMAPMSPPSAPMVAAMPPRAMAEPPPPAPLAAAETQEATTQVLFTARTPVSVRAGETLVLPIVSREVPVARVALYQPAVNAAHPLEAVQVTNDSGGSLPPGVLTLYLRGAGRIVYAGDARLAALPAGETRLLSFAVDQKTQVARDTKSQESVIAGKISRGVLTLTHRDEQTTIYRVKAPADEGRVLLIEHPRQADWELMAPKPGDAELTRTHYRLKQAVAKGATAAIEVRVQRPRSTVVRLAGASVPDLLAYARSAGLGEAQRQALEKLAAMRGEVDRLERQVKDTETARDGIGKDQARLRDNLKAVPAGGDLAKRYLDQLKRQEDDLDKLKLAEDGAREALAKARGALADAIAKTEL